VAFLVFDTARGLVWDGYKQEMSLTYWVRLTKMGTTGLFCGDVLGTTLVLESNEGVRRFTEESTESSELENQVALLDAKL